MSTGVMVVNGSGRIVLTNNSLRQLLPYVGSSDTLENAIVNDARNSSLYDLIIDSVVSRNSLKSEVVEYVTDDGKNYYDVRSRYEDDEENLIVSVTDITNEVTYRKRCRDATIVSAGIITFIALWNILYAVWQKYLIACIAPHTMTVILITIGCFVSWAFLRSTDLKLSEMGLEIRGKGKAIGINAAITFILILIMTLIKIIFVKDYEKLFDLSVFRQLSTMYYPVTVFVQEVLSRGIMHQSLERVFTAKRSSLLAIVVSSFAFAGLHIHLGLMFMLGAGLLLCVFGFIYNKQRSIWALCIPHYFLCIAAEMLGFM